LVFENRSLNLTFFFWLKWTIWITRNYWIQFEQSSLEVESVNLLFDTNVVFGSLENLVLKNLVLENVGFEKLGS